MAKKCIPGVICIENMTLFLLFVLLVLVVYLYYVHVIKIANNSDSQRIVVIQPQGPLATISARRDTLNDPYAPPMRNDSGFYQNDMLDIRGTPGIPVNVRTRGMDSNYQQVGILTRAHGNSGDLILPLMGRRSMSGRDKWQFYTMSTTGNMNTKLPISLNGKSCTSEYGCDDINNGDVVYVEGYSDTFRVTKYENNLFQYIPAL